MFFFFNDTATTEIYTLSLHDALPISTPRRKARVPGACPAREGGAPPATPDRKSTRLNSSHSQISYAVFCLKKKKIHQGSTTGPHPVRKMVIDSPGAPGARWTHRMAPD